MNPYEQIKIVDLADEVWRELGTPPDTQIPYMAFWFRANIGKLNNLIFTKFYIDPHSQEITFPQYAQNTYCNPTGNIPPNNEPPNLITPVPAPWQGFGSKEKDIYKEIFKVKYYEGQVNKFLYAAQFDTIIEVEEGDSHVRRLTKNDLAKTYLALKKEANDRLIYLTHLYKFNTAIGDQVVGDDTYSPMPFNSNMSLGTTYL